MSLSQMKKIFYQIYMYIMTACFIRYKSGQDDNMEKSIKQKEPHSIPQTAEIVQEGSICLPIPSPL